MMRAALVGTGTVVGVGVVLGLNPTGTTSAALGIPLVSSGLRAPGGSAGQNFGPVAPAGAPSASASPTPHSSATPSPEQHASRTTPSQSAAPAPTRARTSTSTRSTAGAAPTHSAAPEPSAPPTATPQARPSPTPSATSASAVGAAVDVGYGIVQVQATVSGGRLVDIQAVQLPYDNPYSLNISKQAWPLLVQEALQAQSAQIAGVSGASYTTTGFEQSLASALVTLGHAA